ncbi:MAG: hypothetical protein AB1894_02420 [Chloroflexota bacterium]
MNVGMLWFDNDPKSGLTTKVARAAAYYRNKYGKTPTLCFVHPSMLTKGSAATAEPIIEEKSMVTEGMEIRSNPSVLPNHFWIGVNGLSDGKAKSS